MASGDFFLKGNIYTIIMCALYTPGENGGGKYGYEIVREIKERTGSKYEIKQPTLYSYLKRLEQQGQIKSFWGTESNGGRRRYYRLTPKGRSDCAEFLSDWEYHKDMLGTLVDNADLETEPIDETEDENYDIEEPIDDDGLTIGEKIEAQDEISRRLAALLAANPQAEPSQEPVEPEETSPASEEFEPEEPVEEIVVEEQTEPVEEISEEIVEESHADENTETEEIVDEESVATEVTEEIAEEAPTIVESPTSDEDPKAKFEVRQDDADEFIQQFDQRVREISQTSDPHPETAENYQHVLMNVIGDQLDEMQDYNSEQREGAQKYYTDHPVALEDVADDLAKQGIRMRIYNHMSSGYKSKTLMPVSAVLCKASWLTFAVVAVYFGILALTSIATASWQPFVIAISVMIILPIALTIFALYDPSRKEKPQFRFNRYILATGILAAIIVLAALGISIISGIELNNYVTVSKQILLPVGIAAIFPLYVVIFERFYIKY